MPRSYKCVVSDFSCGDIIAHDSLSNLQLHVGKGGFPIFTKCTEKSQHIKVTNKCLYCCSHYHYDFSWQPSLSREL